MVWTKFWGWAIDHGLSLEATHLALYLITSDHDQGLHGAMHLPVEIAASDTRIDPATVASAAEELAGAGFILLPGHSWVVIRDHFQYQYPTNRKHAIGCVRAIDALPPVNVRPLVSYLAIQHAKRHFERYDPASLEALESYAKTYQ